MSLPFNIEIEDEIQILQDRLSDLQDLRLVQDKLNEKDFDFAESLYQGYLKNNSLSAKQWYWVQELVNCTNAEEPLYGNFDAVFVMFKIAHANGQGLKSPKVRLLTDGEEFLTLRFFPDEARIGVWSGGYAHYGTRKFLGFIKDNMLRPRTSTSFTETMKKTLHEFSLDPQKVLIAMAKKLGICMYCGKDLTDDRSKSHGYGPVCAQNYQLPWGGKSNKPVTLPEDLSDLFNSPTLNIRPLI